MNHKNNIINPSNTLADSHQCYDWWDALYSFFQTSRELIQSANGFHWWRRPRTSVFRAFYSTYTFCDCELSPFSIATVISCLDGDDHWCIVVQWAPAGASPSIKIDCPSLMDQSNPAWDCGSPQWTKRLPTRTSDNRLKMFIHGVSHNQRLVPVAAPTINQQCKGQSLITIDINHVCW